MRVPSVCKSLVVGPSWNALAMSLGGINILCAARPKQRRHVQTGGTMPGRIVIVHDDPAFVDQIATALKLDGHRVAHSLTRLLLWTSWKPHSPSSC